MHFLLDALEGETPPWTPGYAWPDLYLLPVEGFNDRVSYLRTSLERGRGREGKGKEPVKLEHKQFEN